MLDFCTFEPCHKTGTCLSFQQSLNYAEERSLRDTRHHPQILTQLRPWIVAVEPAIQVAARSALVLFHSDYRLTYFLVIHTKWEFHDPPDPIKQFKVTKVETWSEAKVLREQGKDGLEWIKQFKVLASGHHDRDRFGIILKNHFVDHAPALCFDTPWFRLDDLWHFAGATQLPMDVHWKQHFLEDVAAPDQTFAAMRDRMLERTTPQDYYQRRREHLLTLSKEAREVIELASPLLTQRTQEYATKAAKTRANLRKKQRKAAKDGLPIPQGNPPDPLPDMYVDHLPDGTMGYMFGNVTL
ncbi:hypothetical protein RQP46_009000 [Phenoliferia psychrophenolica]